MNGISFDDNFVKRVKARAKASNLGLGEEEKKLSFADYEGNSSEVLAMILVGSYFEKYDLISIMAAMTEEILEETKNNVIKMEGSAEVANES